MTADSGVAGRRLIVVLGNQLFAPLETTEKLLFSVAAAGFSVLLLAVLAFTT